MNLRSKSLAATASLILVTGMGVFAPVQAKPDCDRTPDAPICNGEPKPKPKPKPKAIAQQVTGSVGKQLLPQIWNS
jgi:hypothetical protein